MFTHSTYDRRDIANSTPVIRLREDSEYYEEITTLLHEATKKNCSGFQKHTSKVSACVLNAPLYAQIVSSFALTFVWFCFFSKSILYQFTPVFYYRCLNNNSSDSHQCQMLWSDIRQLYMYIRELVDSLSRISADAQYMQYLSKSHITLPQIR